MFESKTYLRKFKSLHLGSTKNSKLSKYPTRDIDLQQSDSGSNDSNMDDNLGSKMSKWSDHEGVTPKVFLPTKGKGKMD